MKYPFRIEPFPRQREAMRLIHRVKTVGLFWEMGTGKTKAALDFIGVMMFNKLIGRSVIVCKLRGITTWEREIRKNMLPEVTYAVMRPGPMPVGWERRNIILVNYDYARTQLKQLLKLNPDVVVMDESHRIKNPHARQSRMAAKLGRVAQYRVALTGTEIGNHILDLWSQFRFIRKGLLPDKFKDFKDEYVIYKGFGGFTVHKYKNIRKLGEKIAPYIDIKKSTTGVTSRFIEVPVDMPAEARRQYKQMEEEFVTYVSQETVISAPIVLAKMMKLSQISGGFIRDTETEEEFPLHTAKLEALEDLTDNLLEQDEKRVVIYARFKWELAKIKEVLAPKWTTYTIKGGVTIKEQQLAENLFNESGGAMICQIDSGSESMNLQTARYEIFYSFNYSSISFQQAIKRIDREGQKAPTCFYYLLLCKGTIDRRIYRILRGKKDVLDHVRALVEDIKKGSAK